MEMPASLAFSLPFWLTAWGAGFPDILPHGDEGAMALAIEAAERNVREKTGGPFGAVVVDDVSKAPLAVGVNLVVSAQTSVFHAEVVALLIAQARLGSHDLSLSGARRLTLYTSAEPCAMCMGAIPWSGIRKVVCAARDEDVRAVGFDEGEKPADWIRAYGRRGIVVVRDLMRLEACQVLQSYARQGGSLY